MRHRLFPIALLLAVVLQIGTAAAADGLVKTDTVVGTGKEAVAGATVQVNYTGWLHDPKAADMHGAKFDSSIGRGPFSFPLGAGRVIKGWDQGVAGMKVGGKRTLIIPGPPSYWARGNSSSLRPNMHGPPPTGL